MTLLSLILTLKFADCVNRMTWEMYDFPVTSYEQIELSAIEECKKEFL